MSEHLFRGRRYWPSDKPTSGEQTPQSPDVVEVCSAQQPNDRGPRRGLQGGVLETLPGIGAPAAPDACGDSTTSSFYEVANRLIADLAALESAARTLIWNSDRDALNCVRREDVESLRAALQAGASTPDGGEP